ncbi:tRNA1(Val) (adenine(37)-N6)-methyltransferase [Catenisphaera adipataccumulans]|uniref:tRNA1(Val) A37 N6-methylase TrmN6 n=1 Tax=Catenisphaera adipataccumulans TaxID=700500 RepID=A0A7W8FXG5_9FIRM|nr:methyltransferase [Catenisphaera adipataccumulans]MBB5183700.1 tRNA1(Val) A37 N6-methylase TrmN6 [Catenisphaera adipataccumulans]
MSNLELDYFIDRDLPIYQNREHFRFNTDSKLLAQFAHVRRDDVVLDIGTNNGAILRYLDTFPIEKSYGVEIIPEACELAQLNADTFFRHPCTILNARIQDVQIDPVDVIVSNPPYFTLSETHPETKMDLRQMGRIEKNLTLQELIFHASRLLKSNGRFYFIHRPERLNDILKLLYAHRFQLKTMQIAYHHQMAKSVLFEAVKEGTCNCTVGKPIDLDRLG